jgi:hypothetical protein
MRILILAVVACVSLAFGGSILCGGSVRSVNNVTCQGAIKIDINTNLSAVLEKVAMMTINSNHQGWEITVHFQNGGKFINSAAKDTVFPTQLKINEGPCVQGGKYIEGQSRLGMGLNRLVNYDLSSLQGTDFVWKPGRQSDATLNYVLYIEASWNAEKALPGLYCENVTVVITAAE